MRPSFVKENAHLFVEGSPETLAGFIIILNACVRNTIHLLQPGRCAMYNYEMREMHLGIETRKGTLHDGTDGDLVVLDSQGTSSMFE